MVCEMTSAFPETIKILAQQVKEARVDHAAFEVLIRGCEVSRCRATCCYDGVHLSVEEAAHVETMSLKMERDFPTGVVMESDKGGVKTVIREAEVGELAVDFPEHFAKTRCVFLDGDGYCELQKLSMKEGLDPWFHKPLTCWIHPLVIVPAGKWEERPVLTLVNRVNDPQKVKGYPGFASCTHCGREDSDGNPAWQVLESELKMLGEVCGRDLYGELSAEEVDWVREL